MSAIAGVIAIQPQEISLREAVTGILGKLQHRGRQDEGYVFFQGQKALSFYGTHTHPGVRERMDLPDVHSAPVETRMAFAHRLGTLYSDVHPEEHQPWQDPSRQYLIIFDGEIFNAPQIAKDLHEKGVQLSTAGQAELICQAYQLWGEGLLSRLEGSFAFAIYDQKEDKIFAARDSFGIRPFYYCHDEGIFAFASELKGLFGLPFVSKKMSKSAVFDYLLLGETETQIQSIFRGLSELMPGSAMTLFLPKGNLKIWSFFAIATDSKIERYSRNKVSTLAHRLRKSLAQSVSDHLSPGYPTAYHVNHQLESLLFPLLLKESIREMRQQERPDPSSIYSCIWQEDSLTDDGNEIIKDVCLDLGVHLHAGICSFEDFTENLLKVCYLQDIPFTSLSVFQHYRLMEKAASEGIRLVIDPIGGSQLFASSRRHLVQFLQDQITRGNYSQFFDNLSGAREPFSEKMRILFKLSGKMLFKSTSDDLKESLLRNNQDEFSYLKDNFKDRYFKNLDNKIRSMPESLNQLIVQEIHGPQVKEMLRTADRNSQAFNVELRHPFLSSRTMAEPLLKASSVYKIRGGQTSNLLHKAMRGLIPDFIEQQKLQPLRKAQERIWLRDASQDLKSFVTQDLDDFIDSRAIQKDWDKLFQSGNPARQDFLWRVINLGIWRHVYFN